uniref:High potential iron-sulfur proteins family profile domain-containing protein n=1 Tax=viral metagenome TaxID=1070528 RepID=A0A6C0F2U9_9ZZZZ
MTEEFNKGFKEGFRLGRKLGYKLGQKKECGSADIEDLFSKKLVGAAPMVKEKDAQASALGYKEDASKVDKTKFPKCASGQNCGSCALFKGKAEDAAGGCPLFADKQVARAGWCSAYAKKG